MFENKDDYKNKIKQLIDHEVQITTGNESSIQYALNHKKRHKKIFNLCLKSSPQKDINVLDIGRSSLTELLNTYYQNLSTLGLSLLEDNGGHRELSDLQNIDHITFDLNESDNINAWPKLNNSFDLVVFSETIEHLIIAPEFVMLFLNYILKPGGILVMSTPNAVSLRKRLLMLIGKNPFEKIRFYKNNPGHFREYTKNEISQIAEMTGYNVVICKTLNFFLYPSIYILKIIGKLADINNDIIAILKKKD